MHTDVKYYFVPPYPLEGNRTSSGCPKTENTTVYSPRHLHAIWPTSPYPIWVNARCKMVTALAWRLENLPWRIQIPRDKKPRGEADRCCERWAQHGRKQGSISPKGLRPCPPGNLRIILFPPLSLCSHRGTALGLRIAPGNWGEKAKVREFNIASKPLAK